MTGQLARRLFTTDEYHRMVDAGILAEKDRVELIEGEIIQMSPIGPSHASTVDRLAHLFIHRLRRRAIVRVQGPVVVNRHSEPQPDLSVLKLRGDFYSSRHPQPRDIVLVVEVMVSSEELDRHVKLPLYARCGVAEVWLVDPTKKRIDIYRRPTLRGYQVRKQATSGERVALGAFPRTFFRVDEIFG